MFKKDGSTKHFLEFGGDSPAPPLAASWGVAVNGDELYVVSECMCVCALFAYTGMDGPGGVGLYSNTAHSDTPCDTAHNIRQISFGFSVVEGCAGRYWVVPGLVLRESGMAL